MMLLYIAVSCSVLQCVAVYCSALQCAAVCCSVLQCAAVSRHLLQRDTVCCSSRAYRYCQRCIVAQDSVLYAKYVLIES